MVGFHKMVDLSIETWEYHGGFTCKHWGLMVDLFDIVKSKFFFELLGIDI
jgi:hypothetical protein